MSQQLEFINHPTRTPLTAREVSYWKLNLNRVLKVGAEFEFNLPNKTTGTCKGKSFTCSCKKYGKEENSCWQVCLNEKECSSIPSIYHCANRSVTCRTKKCVDCKTYKFECIGLMCSNHISACITCKDFEPDCSNCAYRFDPNKDPDAIRQFCTDKFKPSGSYGIVSKSGVHNVVTDGSLLGKKGMEVITTGRRVDYWEFYNMSKDIIDYSVKKGAYINERCSIHMHGLASYYGKIPGVGNPGAKIREMEKSMPEIVLANLHQLLRKYQNAITWMSSALGEPSRITRWEKFRVSTLEISALTNHMREVNEKVVHKAGGSKYGWANYKFCQFDKDGEVQRLHVEIRAMDGLLSPSACAGFACLWYALFIKAVELSRYGVIKVGNDMWLEKALIVKNSLMNNTSDWQNAKDGGRFSNTSEVHKYTDILVSESFELIAQLKHILAPVGPAYDVLEKLAEMPCSIRRCEGLAWDEIEEQLEVKLTKEGALEYEIRKIIDTRKVVNAKDTQNWIAEVAGIFIRDKLIDTKINPVRSITECITSHVTNGEMVWADKIGTMITI